MFDRYLLLIPTHYRFIYLILLCVGTEVIRGDIPQRIIGGKIIKIEDYPFMGYLELNGSHVCGAAIIDPKHLITAAHCINSKEKSYRVVTGTTNQNQGVIREIKQIVKHENYSRTDRGEEYDVAVIKLVDPIQFNEVQQPIRLPTSNIRSNTIAQITGWGMTQWGYNETYSKVLQELDVMVLPTKLCSLLGLSRLEKSPLVHCGYAGIGRGICAGDSGSPLSYNNTLIGIASRFLPCGKGVPDIYTKVFSFIDFINENINS